MKKEHLYKIINASSEGIIVVDRKGVIELYNKKAKKIFGLEYKTSYGHMSGNIEDGDIVILVDSFIGGDDGGLQPKDLMVIGIDDSEIKNGDGIVAIGKYNSQENTCLYKVHQGEEDIKLAISTEMNNLEIRASIDYFNKYVEINVGNHIFGTDYIYAIGFIVIVNPQTKEIKFYQDRGYTARKESVNDILKGKHYLPKSREKNIIEVEGKHILELHEEVEGIHQLLEVAELRESNIYDKIWNINGRTFFGKVISIDKELGGAALIIEDISEAKVRRKDSIEIYESLIRRNFIAESYGFESVVGESDKNKKVKELAWKASKSNSTVLILGESGTGKSLLAKEIHKKSNRKDRPFIHVNCAAIPNSLLESELFGYDKGAFTGANNKGKIGYFEMSHGGTLFLDEIGEMSAHMQVKVLNVIQNKFLYRIGGGEKIHVDIRIIAATNKDLEEEIEKGTFRSDLYYRINVFPILIPPLRERIEDINLLMDKLMDKICERAGYENKKISSEAISKLKNYNWPGNIRELENIIERAVNLCEGEIILSKDIEIITCSDEYLDKISYKKCMEDFEKDLLETTIKRFDGNKKKAMEFLEVPRTTFYDKLKKYDL